MRKREAGFTLLEVMVGISILAIVLMGFMRASGRMIRSVSDDRVRTIAAAAADARIASALQWPTYATLDSALAGTESGMPYAGWTRVTSVVRTGGVSQTNDYKRVTVTVTGPGLPAPVRRTIAIAAQ